MREIKYIDNNGFFTKTPEIHSYNNYNELKSLWKNQYSRERYVKAREIGEFLDIMNNKHQKLENRYNNLLSDYNQLFDEYQRLKVLNNNTNTREIEEMKDKINKMEFLANKDTRKKLKLNIEDSAFKLTRINENVDKTFTYEFETDKLYSEVITSWEDTKRTIIDELKSTLFENDRTLKAISLSNRNNTLFISVKSEKTPDELKTSYLNRF